MVKLSKEHLEFLGLMTVSFAELELSIISAISQLMSIESTMTIRLVAGDSCRVLLSKFEKLFIYKINDEKFVKEFKILFRDLETTNDKRNKYIHSWWLSNKKGEIKRLKFRSRLNKKNFIIDAESFDVEKLKLFCNDIHNINWNLSNFMYRVCLALNIKHDEFF